MSREYSLTRVIADHGGEPINGWSGYTTDTYVKQWFFIDGVVMGYVEAMTAHPSTTPNLFTMKFGSQSAVSAINLDDAKDAFMVALDKWMANAIVALGTR